MKHKAVIGLGYGDEGKGTFTQYLSQDALAVVRFNGGGQAGHNVVLNDGTHHTFSQFGAGTLNGIPTILSKFFILNPITVTQEASALLDKTGADPFLNLMVSENAIVTTPLHILANHHKETQRGKDRHGSVGLGIGETKMHEVACPQQSIYAKDLGEVDTLYEKMKAHQEWLQEQGFPLLGKDPLLYAYRLHNDAMNLNIVSDEQVSEFLNAGKIVFEGAQGMLLDADHGFFPHVTFSTTSSKNVLSLLEESGQGRQDVELIGAVRTYHTRHGAGPMPSEISEPSQTAQFPEPHNDYGEYQGGWRVGKFDLPLLKYALRATELDSLAFSHMDAPVKDYISAYDEEFINPQNQGQQKRNTNVAYRKAGKGTLSAVGSVQGLVDTVVESTQLPARYLSFGAKSEDKRVVE